MAKYFRPRGYNPKYSSLQTAYYVSRKARLQRGFYLSPTRKVSPYEWRFMASRGRGPARHAGEWVVQRMRVDDGDNNGGDMWGDGPGGDGDWDGNLPPIGEGRMRMWFYCFSTTDPLEGGGNEITYRPGYSPAFDTWHVSSQSSFGQESYEYYMSNGGMYRMSAHNAVYRYSRDSPDDPESDFNTDAHVYRLIVMYNHTWKGAIPSMANMYETFRRKAAEQGEQLLENYRFVRFDIDGHTMFDLRDGPDFSPTPDNPYGPPIGLQPDPQWDPFDWNEEPFRYERTWQDDDYYDPIPPNGLTYGPMPRPTRPPGWVAAEAADWAYRCTCPDFSAEEYPYHQPIAPVHRTYRNWQTGGNWNGIYRSLNFPCKHIVSMAFKTQDFDNIFAWARAASSDLSTRELWEQAMQSYRDYRDALWERHQAEWQERQDRRQNEVDARVDRRDSIDRIWSARDIGMPRTSNGSTEYWTSEDERRFQEGYQTRADWHQAQQDYRDEWNEERYEAFKRSDGATTIRGSYGGRNPVEILKQTQDNLTKLGEMGAQILNNGARYGWGDQISGADPGVLYPEVDRGRLTGSVPAGLNPSMPPRSRRWSPSQNERQPYEPATPEPSGAEQTQRQIDWWESQKSHNTQRSD